MAVQFARKLKDLRDAAVRNSRAELRFAFGVVADVILDTCDEDLQALTIDRRGALDALEIARGAAEVIDACQVIESCLFTSDAEHRFEERELPRDRSHHAISRFLELDIRGTIVENPFVYAVWSPDPDQYLHVGRTQDGERGGLRLDGRGELLAALQHGSLVTVMHPSPASATVMRELEAAIVSLLDRHKLLCDRTARPAGVPRALAAAQLAEIGRLLLELASRVHAPAHPAVAG